MKMRATLKITATIVALLGCHIASHAADSASVELATGNHTKMARLGVQWKWKKQWWKSNGTYVGGYWDLTFSQWRSTRYQDISNRTQNITSIGITPVFRLQNDSQRGLYGEAGIGAHYLSNLYNNNGRQLSTNFEFGDHLAIGYVFQNKLDLGLKIQHFSNAGIKHPNSGVNFVVARLSYSF